MRASNRMVFWERDVLFSSSRRLKSGIQAEKGDYPQACHVRSAFDEGGGSSPVCSSKSDPRLALSCPWLGMRLAGDKFCSCDRLNVMNSVLAKGFV